MLISSVKCTSPARARLQNISLRITAALDIVSDASRKYITSFWFLYTIRLLKQALVILLSTNILWTVRISLRKKLALAAIFSLTFFIITVAIIRVSVVTDGQSIDFTWLLFWGGIEKSVGLSNIQPIVPSISILNGDCKSDETTSNSHNCCVPCILSDAVHKVESTDPSTSKSNLCPTNSLHILIHQQEASPPQLHTPQVACSDMEWPGSRTARQETGLSEGCSKSDDSPRPSTHQLLTPTEKPVHIV